ncbi:ABC-F family ATP-binding cassette domain-containing protein [uncultured Clostridium sp.]|uniref:ABC-F family ATP-binding cassette domain-containing protein n=1 Tax=uncultured Clostridium sp. TaxID=59620 RepID=UPI00260DF99E|nr:ABC-F family ATP-binding cassette domain-containing protein [uncultured Clostridium sp.]
MIKVEKLSYSFPQKDLYNDISFTLEAGQHCAFIGTNGSGKSTLIDILVDPDKYMFDGILEKSPNCRIGYVSQISQIDDIKDITVFDYISEDFIRLQNKIDAICEEMATSSELEALMEDYQEALDAFEAINGDQYPNIIDRTLNLANLGSYKDMLISELSGGEFKLVQVIKSMLNNPDLIIMDEPDVFLDFENLTSLKNLINSHKGTMLVITHNRYLLNHCFNKIIHLENKEIQEFDGNYIDYNFSLLQTKIELQELAAADDEEIERNEVIIDKLRDLATENAEAFRGRHLRARVKIQERLEKRRIKAPFVYIKKPTIYFSTDKKLGDDVILKVTDYSAVFDDVVLENVSFEIKADEKVAIVGPNGTGKTTLLQDIFKNNNPAIEINENAQVAYLSQILGNTLNHSKTISEEFIDSGFETYDQVLESISEYGFDEKSLNQKINALSGGEKILLQIAKISATDANLLILDEPTSHLDTYSQIALEKALQNYNGAILMVSHDFYSIINCMDTILIVEDKSIRRMNMKKFKKMIYAKHFSKDYLEIEQNKKLIEVQIETALKNTDFILAKELSIELERLIKLL